MRAAWAPASTPISMARKATTRLAAADIALQQADHALGLADVGLDLAGRGLLAGRQLERQRRQRQLAQAAVAFGDVPGDAAVVMAHQGDRELAGQKLVEGEARARRMHRREVALLGRRMSLGERRLPVGPAIAGEIRRVLPFRQLRRALDGGGDRLLHRPLGEAGGQAIDRLDPQDRLALVERHDMVGVRHLHLALVEIDLAAHHPDLARGQQLLEVILAAVEVGEAEPAGLVAAPDAIGLARIARHQVLVDRHGDRGDLAGLGLGDLGRVAAVDHGEGQVPEQVDDQGPGQPLHELAPAAARFRAAMSLGRTGASGCAGAWMLGFRAA